MDLLWNKLPLRKHNLRIEIILNLSADIRKI